MTGKKMFWCSRDVRSFCIGKNLYTKGDCASYDRMLIYVKEHEFPTAHDIEKVVIDILFHSDGYGTIFDDWDDYAGYRKLKSELVSETIYWIEAEK